MCGIRFVVSSSFFIVDFFVCLICCVFFSSLVFYFILNGKKKFFFRFHILEKKFQLPSFFNLLKSVLGIQNFPKFNSSLPLLTNL